MSELKDLKKEIILIIKNIIDTLDQHFNSRSGTLLEILGGDCLPVTADDLRYRLDISNIAIEHMNFDKLLKAGDDDDIKITRMLLQDIKKLTIVTRDMHAANLFNNPNAHKSIVNIYSFIEFYVADIQRKIGSPDLLSLNAQSKRRYEKLLETISKVELEANGISEKSKIIIDAYNIAEDLPATSGELKSAKKLVDDSLLDITLKDKEAKKSLEEVQKTLSEIQNSQKVTESLVESFNKKYAAFTSTGLAAAFALRAKERKLSVQKWTLLLIFSLTICGFIGAERFPLLLQTLGNKTDFVTVFINMFYGFLSMAPAIWLAWISSAQIGMNYRISEDYNYKSTLASSYEGFRSEAIRIDPYLEAKLFIIAMERLDEIPLRFVDPEVKNSPLHDLISSKEFNDVIENSDELKLRVISIIKNLKDVPKDMLEYIESLKK